MIQGLNQNICGRCRCKCNSYVALCLECYNKSRKREEELVRKREEELMKEIVELKRFLKIHAPVNPGSPGFTDVVLVPSSDELLDNPNTSIPAHKAVLVSRSPVFKAMLESDPKMEESLSGIIKISDVSYDTLKSFVNYLYMAETCTSLNNQLAGDLLVLAEKYEVQHLKSYCEDFLISKAEWETSVSMLCFAHQHNAHRLLQCCLSIIADNMNEFTQTDQYSQLVDSDSKLVVKIYEYYCNSNKITERSLPNVPSSEEYVSGRSYDGSVVPRC